MKKIPWMEYWANFFPEKFDWKTLKSYGSSKHFVSYYIARLKRERFYEWLKKIRPTQYACWENSPTKLTERFKVWFKSICSIVFQFSRFVQLFYGVLDRPGEKFSMRYFARVQMRAPLYIFPFRTFDHRSMPIHWNGRWTCWTHVSRGVTMCYTLWRTYCWRWRNWIPNRRRRRSMRWKSFYSPRW